jgi:hypothetical protein
MKQICTLFFGVFIWSTSFGGNTITERLSKPLYVVLSNENVAINQEIRNAMDQHWVISDIEYISEDEYEPLSWTEDNCFLIYQKNQSVDGDGNMVRSEVIRMVAFTKKGKMVQNVAGTPVLNTDRIHEDDLANSVRILQDKVRFELYKEEGETAFESYAEMVEESTGIVKLKKLYISAQDLEVGMDYASIRTLYDGDVRIVDRSYIDMLIEQKASDAVYVLIDYIQTSGISYISTKTILDAESGAVLYKNATTSISPKGFGKRDFKKLAD